MGSHDISREIVTRPPTGQPRNRCWIPRTDWKYSILHVVPKIKNPWSCLRFLTWPRARDASASTWTFLMSGCLLKVAKSDHFIINTLLALLRETLRASRVELLAEASEVFTDALFRLVVIRSKAASSDFNLSGAPQKRWKLEVLNRDCP